ncbi:MAG: hypothetical protein ACRC33_02365, partial [Gemmataceae bacterium]
ADIPALLEAAEGSVPLFSQPSFRDCRAMPPYRMRAGLYALYLIETIRKDGDGIPGFMRLRGPAGYVPYADEPATHGEVLSAYRRWWLRVSDLPPMVGKCTDPLVGTGLKWW